MPFRSKNHYFYIIGDLNELIIKQRHNDMRTIKGFSKLFLLFCIITLTSCGKDDDRQEFTLKDAVFEYTYDLGVANKGGQITTPESSITLDALLVEYPYNGTIKSGKLNLTSETSIIVSAKNSNLELKNFTLTVNKMNLNLGNLTVDNTELYNSDNLDYVKKFFNRMVSEKKLTISSTFTPSRKITDEDELTIKFVIKADYIYLQ